MSRLLAVSLLLLTTGCVTGGEERGFEDNSFHVAFVRWQGQLADGTDAGSGCVLTNDKDSFGKYIVLSADPGAKLQLTETFQRFRTTSDTWAAHPNDDAYWCAKPGAERWSSVRNPGCWQPVDPSDPPTGCAGFTMVASEIVPPGDYPAASYVKNVDGFRLTIELSEKGEQCIEDCGSGQAVAFVVE